MRLLNFRVRVFLKSAVIPSKKNQSVLIAKISSHKKSPIRENKHRQKLRVTRGRMQMICGRYGEITGHSLDFTHAHSQIKELIQITGTSDKICTYARTCRRYFPF